MLGKSRNWYWISYLQILFIFFFTNQIINGQDVSFSQLLSNPLYLNPAYAGTKQCGRLIMNYRNQWPSIPNNYVTYSASFDKHIEKLNGGVGLLAMTDAIGTNQMKINQISAIYSYKASLSRHSFFRTAIQATYMQYSLNSSELVFGDQLDPVSGPIYSTTENIEGSYFSSKADFSSGIFYSHKKIFGGFTINHLNRPKIGFFTNSRLPVKLTLHSGLIIDISNSQYTGNNSVDITITPQFIWQKQDMFNLVVVGGEISFEPLIVGIWMKNNLDNSNSFTTLAGLESEGFRMGYSYDISIGKAVTGSGGAHEISLGYLFGCKNKKTKNKNIINCPSF